MDAKRGRVGKLPPPVLERLVLGLRGFERREVMVGPSVGEDAAVIGWPAGRFLLAASDPIVGAKAGAGRLLVHVNANDIAAKGGEPAYFLATLIFPSCGAEGDIALLMKEMDEACREIGVAIVGGHTEFGIGYEKPVIVGTMLGQGRRVLRAESIKPRDVIVVTKHIGLEGMTILASDRPDLLKGILSEEEMTEVLCWKEGLSVLPESRLLRDVARFMHDPTEGGFRGALQEVLRTARRAAEIDDGAVPVHPITAKVASFLGFDPLRLISSGALLAVLPPECADEAMASLRTQEIEASIVGCVTDEAYVEEEPAQEELWRLLELPGGERA
jgi:hydrogenase maturation factor